jgi:hypothetical protein
LLAKRRISDDAAGFAALLQLLVEAGDDPEAPIPMAIETSHGLLVACLRATGRSVFPINPMSASRYRDPALGCPAHGCSTLNWIWIWPTFRDRAGPGVSPDGVTAS